MTGQDRRSWSQNTTVEAAKTRRPQLGNDHSLRDGQVKPFSSFIGGRRGNYQVDGTNIKLCSGELNIKVVGKQSCGSGLIVSGSTKFDEFGSSPDPGQ